MSDHIIRTYPYLVVIAFNYDQITVCEEWLNDRAIDFVVTSPLGKQPDRTSLPLFWYDYSQDKFFDFGSETIATLHYRFLNADDALLFKLTFV
jgi:hypothetical protein